MQRPAAPPVPAASPGHEPADEQSSTLSTEQKATLLDHLLRHGDSTLCIVAEDGRVRFQSPNIERLLGFTAEEIRCLPAAAVIHPDDLPEVMRALTASQDQAQPIRMDYRGLHKSGAHVPIRAVCVDLRSDPHVRGYLVTAQELSELHAAQKQKEQLEDELRQAQKMEALGTLAGGIAHDFNNILQLMTGFTEVAQRHLAGREQEAAQQLGHVLDAAGRARDLVRQILTFSRRVERQRSPTQLGLVLHQALELVRSFQPAHVEARLHLPAASTYVLGDPSSLHQVVFNLCMNALQAMQTTGSVLEVELTLQQPPSNPAEDPTTWVRLRVRDDGCGMDETTSARMFDPFFTTKPPGEGTGLGLSVVHGIVTEHGGRLAVQSCPAEGTTVDVYLPVIERAKISPLVEERGPVTGSERVAFVDDEAGIGTLARSFLEHLGYTVTCFASGEPLLEVLRQDPGAFDVIVTDLHMPRLSGVELATRARALGVTTPLVLTSGYGELLALPAELHIHQMVSKPYGSLQLGRAIRKALDTGDETNDGAAT